MLEARLRKAKAAVATREKEMLESRAQLDEALQRHQRAQDTLAECKTCALDVETEYKAYLAAPLPPRPTRTLTCATRWARCSRPFGWKAAEPPPSRSRRLSKWWSLCSRCGKSAWPAVVVNRHCRSALPAAMVGRRG